MRNTKLFFPFLMTLILGGLSGCSHMPAAFWTESVDELVAQHEYSRAIDLIESTQPINRDQLSAVKRQADRYRRKELNQVRSFIAQKKWGLAQKHLNTLVEDLPWHASFSLVQTDLNEQKAEEKRLIDTQKALAEANLLKANVLVDQFQERSHSGNLLWNSQTHPLQDRKQSLSYRLHELSIAALAKQDYFNAQKTYAEALSLNPNLNRPELSLAISKGVSQSQVDAIDQKQATLVKQLHTAIKAQDFSEIQLLQSILQHPPFSGKEVQIVLKKADKLLINTAKRKDKEADTAYRVGNLSQAIELWRDAQQLAPELIGIQDKLARAVKVQKKLAELRQKQP